MARTVLVTGVSRHLGGLAARALAADPSVDRVVGVDVIPPPHSIGYHDMLAALVKRIAAEPEKYPDIRQDGVIVQQLDRLSDEQLRALGKRLLEVELFEPNVGSDSMRRTEEASPSPDEASPP